MLPFDLVGTATDVIDALGLVGVVVLVALEAVIPPIPSEVVLLLSGFLVGEGRFPFVGSVAAATLGSVIGALLLYAVGALLGEERLRSLLLKIGRPLMVSGRDLDRADRWFERHGGRVVFFGRLVPLVRSLVSIPAGAERMPLTRFVLFTTLGSALWNVVFVGIGYLLGDNWEKAEPYSNVLDLLVVAAVVVGVVVLLRRRRRLTAARADRPLATSED